MTSNIEFKYNGKVYQSVPEQGPNSCSGCVFVHLDNDCVYTSSTFNCSSNKVIWQEKAEMTWTLDEIHQAYEDWDMYDGFSVLARILRKQKQGQDPEYQKYLELKAKFGD